MLVTARGPRCGSHNRFIVAFFRSFGAAAVSLACGGGSPGLYNLPVAEDVAGTYELNLGDLSSACGLADFDQGRLANAKLDVAQNDADATATLTSATEAAWLDDWLGSDEFTGSVASNHLVLTSEGEVTHDVEGCSYTVKATIDAHVEDGVLTGTIAYAPQPAGGDCSKLADCRAEQDLTSAVPTK